MKKDEEKLQDDFEEIGDVYDWFLEEGYQGRSENQIKYNARIGGCTVLLFFILLFWYGIYELIKWLS